MHDNTYTLPPDQTHDNLERFAKRFILRYSMSVLEQPLVFVDVETNGLNHIRGHVIEVAAIRVEDGEITREFNSLIDPGSDLPQFITRLTGITTNDLNGAPAFADIADELADVLDGAVFVAHNVRFDYSFIKQEFKRVGKPFLPKQLCTVKLSRTLYPEERSHKLESLIQRHGFHFKDRHRAYDDAHVLWQFMQHAQTHFPPSLLEKAVKRQLGRPALPKNLDSQLVSGLPDGPGVYIFEDERGQPIYIGKSINIRKRVLQHFGHDHDVSKEFKIAQGIHGISTHETSGELEALLLESRLIKEKQPLYNVMLRKTTKVTIARHAADTDGYLRVSLEDTDTDQLSPDGGVLAVYPRKGKAKESLESIRRTFDLCPKLMGLENGKGACFLSQLGKCRGACVGREPAGHYNQRLLTAFETRRIKDWPYKGAILLQEKSGDTDQPSTGLIVDQWRVLANVRQDEFCDTPEVTARSSVFDLDTYKILRDFLTTKLGRLKVQPLSSDQLASLLR